MWSKGASKLMSGFKIVNKSSTSRNVLGSLLLGSTTSWLVYQFQKPSGLAFMQNKGPEALSDAEVLSQQTPEFQDYLKRLEAKVQTYGKQNHLGEGKYKIMELTSDGYKKLNLEAAVILGGICIVPYKLYQGYKQSTMKRSLLICVPLSIGLAFLYQIGSITVRQVSIWPKNNCIDVEMGYSFAKKSYRFKIGEIDRDEPDQELEKELKRKMAKQNTKPTDGTVAADAAFAPNRAKRKSSAQGE